MLHRLFRPILVVSAVISICLLVLSTPALTAVAIGVTPGKLEFSVRPGGTEVQTLHVINQSNRISEFQVYVEGEYEEWFVISPGEFTLPPQQNRAVEIAVAPPFTATNEHDFAICVVSLPPGSALRIGAGVKVPVHVQINEYPVALIAGGGVAALALIAGTIALIWRRRKTRHV